MAQHTLTMSRVEQAAVLRHLEVQRPHASVRDGPVLDAIDARLRVSTTATLGRIEVFTLLRNLRAQRDRLGSDMRALEERVLRGGHNGGLNDAHRLLDADATLLDDVIRRLWDMI